MKALVVTKYGSPADTQVKEVARPSPKTNEVLVEVKATAVNDFDWGLVRGKPSIYRLMFGVLKPRHPIPGMELSGVVVQCGDGASKFGIGDEVYGDTSDHGFGTFAEYVSLNENALVKKPADMPFEDAAALPHAGLLALQGLVDVGGIQRHQRILINGAGGGVGTLALNLAKMYDAEVTGVDTGDKLDDMISMGFDHVIDYKRQDFTKLGKQYDLILDTKTCRSSLSILRALNKNGKYVTVGGHLRWALQVLLSKPLIKLFSSKSVYIVALKSNKGLNDLAHLYSEKKIMPVIDGPYQLDDLPRLIQYFGDGRHTGKIVIGISQHHS